MTDIRESPAAIRLPRAFCTWRRGEKAFIFDRQYYTAGRWTFDDAAHQVEIVGRPILGMRIDPEGVCQELTQTGGEESFLRQINGEFLLVWLEKTRGRLHVVTDRFVSIPFYHVAEDGEFTGSVFYNDLWLHLKRTARLRLNQPAFFEFLWLQRLMGDRTYDTRSRFLPAATHWVYDGETVEEIRYWTPSFEKTRESLGACADELAARLKRSLLRKTSDTPRRWGLFLSGGLDSRIVLAAFPGAPTCFTVTIRENNELRIAREVALSKGCWHVHLPLPSDPYTDYLDTMTRLGGGMYSYGHALFCGYRPAVAPWVDVAFHGRGIDYMFQGMYVPSSRIRIVGQPTFLLRQRSLGPDLVKDFLDAISYRLKDPGLMALVQSRLRDELMNALRLSVRTVLDEGESFCMTRDNMWEHLITHALGRHYPNTNLTSIGTCAEQRTAAFDNEVFDLYHALPKRYRLNARIARMALTRIDSELARMRNGNTNMPAGYQPWQQQLFWLRDYCRRKLGFGGQANFWPSAEERTWPDNDRVVRQHEKLRAAMLALADSDALAELGLFDMDRLRRYIQNTLDKSKGGGALMMSLATLDRFLRQE